MSGVMDLNKPYRALDQGSDPDLPGPDFAEQGGIVFAWSDSNCRYEVAWWLYPTANAQSSLVRHLRETRPGPGPQKARLA